MLSLLQLLRILAENDGICKFQLSWFLMKKEFALYAILTPSELGYCTELYPSDPMLFMHFIQYIKSRLYERFPLQAAGPTRENYYNS